MIEIYFKTTRDTSFHRVSEIKPGSFIYVNDATQDDLAKIAEITGIDILDIKDSLDKYEQPRIEHFDDTLIFFVRHPGTEESGLYTQTLTLIVTSAYVIAISPHHANIVERLLTVHNDLSPAQKAKLILHIFLKISQDYTNNIKKDHQSIMVAEQPNHIIQSSDIISLTKNEEILNQYMTSIVSMRILLETLASSRYMHFYEADIELLDDLMIAMRQSEDVCRVNIKSIRSLRDSYQIIFTNDVNRTMKLLTAVMIIVMLPTVIASIYGMNVSLPLQSKAYAFPLVLATILFITIVSILLFRKKR